MSQAQAQPNYFCDHEGNNLCFRNNPPKRWEWVLGKYVCNQKSNKAVCVNGGTTRLSEQQ
jgi:hypothetical protein